MLKTLFNKNNKMKLLVLLLTITLTNYSVVKTTIEKGRVKLNENYVLNEKKSVTIDAARVKLTEYLYNDIFTHWYTTKWSFEGHSETPKKGTIACGYFVSTTLKDVGFNLNRYKLAQKSPEEEAKVIACGTSIEKLQNVTKQELKKYFLKQKDGIYFIGLDFHVGYIYKKNQEVYFIHSNYIDNKGVMKETIENSKAIVSSKYFITNITHNDILVKKWIMKEVVTTN
jgi:hypothetical protein